MVAQSAIVDTPDQLTPEWLTAALGSDVIGDSEITAVSVRSLGTGQMSDSMRVAISYDRAGPGPASVVAKVAAADETSRATGLGLRAYEAEVRFYQELADQLPIRTPGVHHAEIDLDTGRFTLLLEDLSPASQGDQIEGCEPAVAQAALRQLVNLHAPRWNDPSLERLDWLTRDPEQRRAGHLELLPALWAAFQDRYRDRLSSTVTGAGAALFSRLDRYLMAEGRPWTVTHGDYRLDNLLITPGTEPGTEQGGNADGDCGNPTVTVVDWQTCSVGSAANDVAYFIGAGLPTDLRRQIETELVGDYHRDLLAAGVEGYDWDQCLTDYRRGTWAGLVMAIAASMLVERTARGDQMFLTMAERHALHAIDQNATELLDT